MNPCYTRSFHELRVYQTAREVSQTVFRVSHAFPKEERDSLTNQFRRSVRSIGAEIADASGD
ncbi:MAG TPA: hypothetical protein DCE44_23510 [Verrucomicrobiales bacterium]|nr:hypothetical protein [Verrucomicrobiales bacterium]